LVDRYFAAMALERGKFRQLVTENTLRGCQIFMGVPASDISAIAAFVIPSPRRDVKFPTTGESNFGGRARNGR
jgi:hypothetical protein